MLAKPAPGEEDLIVSVRHPPLAAPAPSSHPPPRPPAAESAGIKPVPELPAPRARSVPPAAETLPGFDVLTWYGLFAPVGTPREIVARLQGEIVKALASADVKQRLIAQGFDADGNTSEQFTEVIRRDLARWQKVIAGAKIRVE